MGTQSQSPHSWNRSLHHTAQGLESHSRSWSDQFTSAPFCHSNSPHRRLFLEPVCGDHFEMASRRTLGRTLLQTQSATSHAWRCHVSREVPRHRYDFRNCSRVPPAKETEAVPRTSDPCVTSYWQRCRTLIDATTPRTTGDTNALLNRRHGSYLDRSTYRSRLRWANWCAFDLSRDIPGQIERGMMG